MSRLGEFANIYELLDENDSSGVETGKKAQSALAERKAAAAAALAPPPQAPKPANATGQQKPTGERRQERNFNGERGPRSDRPREDRPPRTDRPPREDRPPRTDRPPREDRPPRTDRPPREDRPPRTDRPPRENRPYKPRPEGEAPFSGEGQAGAAPREQRSGPRPDRGYERRQPGDQDPRQGKREFDRRSGTGRGKEAAKGGAGKGGWGSLEDEAAVGLDGAAAAEVAGEAKKEGEEAGAEATPTTEAAAEPVVDDEPKVRTLDEFLVEKKSKAGAALPPARQAGEGEDSSAWQQYSTLKKEEEALFVVSEKTKKAKDPKEKESTEKKVAPDQVLRFQQERRDRPERTERDGAKRGGREGSTPRGSTRGGPSNQGGQRRGNASAPNFGDASAFPTLSTKA